MQFWKAYTWPQNLSRAGILGMNRRNHSYISRYNPRGRYPLVDDKLKTKQLALASGVAIPKLIGTISEHHEVSMLASMVRNRPGFCIKPARGSGGKGVLLVTHQEEGCYFKPDGKTETLENLERHASNILSGLHSLGGKPDTLLIENLITFDKIFEGYSFEGVPDTRVIVFKGFPVIAMIRLSTSVSLGKANLHQGAVGVGLCLRTGRALRAVQHNTPVLRHPDTGLDFHNLSVPHWDTLLTLAASCYEMSGLGYIGTDMVLDGNRGPLLLELNARPGLSIQTANGRGLLPSLRTVEGLGDTAMNISQRVKFSQQHFGVFDR